MMASLCRLTDILLFLGLIVVIKAEVFDKHFLLRMQDITETNRKLNETVEQQKGMMNELNKTIEALNLILDKMNGKC